MAGYVQSLGRREHARRCLPGIRLQRADRLALTAGRTVYAR